MTDWHDLPESLYEDVSESDLERVMAVDPRARIIFNPNLDKFELIARTGEMLDYIAPGGYSGARYLGWTTWSRAPRAKGIAHAVSRFVQFLHDSVPMTGSQAQAMVETANRRKAREDRRHAAEVAAYKPDDIAWAEEAGKTLERIGAKGRRQTVNEARRHGMSLGEYIARQS